MIPLCNVDGVASVLFTKRSSNLRAHKNEVCFPGGKVRRCPHFAAVRALLPPRALRTPRCTHRRRVTWWYMFASDVVRIFEQSTSDRSSTFRWFRILLYGSTQHTMPSLSSTFPPYLSLCRLCVVPVYCLDTAAVMSKHLAEPVNVWFCVVAGRWTSGRTSTSSRRP